MSNSRFLFVLLTFMLASLSTATEPEAEETKNEVTESPEAGEGEDVTEAILPTELIAEVFTEGNCTEKGPVKEEDTVTVHYEGFQYYNNEKFDSSIDRKEPLTFKLGEEKVVKGWDIGLVGMCIGERRLLTVPPQLGYGEKGVPPVIEPNSVLKFDIYLLDIQ